MPRRRPVVTEPPTRITKNNLAKFKNADVIGHPGGEVFSQFASASGYICAGAGTAFMPYLLNAEHPGSALLFTRRCVPRGADPRAIAAAD